MRSQALIWTTDTTLRVTSLTARLRDFARIGSRTDELHVGDLWGGPIPAEAHELALQGRSLTFESNAYGARLAFEIEPLLDPDGAIAGVAGRAIELAEGAITRYSYSELSQLALHDPLTRLLNRAAFEERLAAALARCERTGSRCAVLFIDLDDFKRVNDEHGHAQGDRVLVAVADRLVRHVRASDTVARIGGDEFVVLIDDLQDDAAAAEAARKMLRSLDEPLRAGAGTIRVRASIGVATHPGGGFEGAAALLAGADREMYAVKRNGGNGIKIASAWQQAHSSPAQPHFATLESA